MTLVDDPVVRRPNESNRAEMTGKAASHQRGIGDVCGPDCIHKYERADTQPLSDDLVILGTALGEGAEASVKLGQHVDSGDFVAVKLMRDYESTDERRRALARRLFANEVAILSQVEHPNIAGLVWSSEADGVLVVEHAGDELFEVGGVSLSVVSLLAIGMSWLLFGSMFFFLTGNRS